MVSMLNRKLLRDLMAMKGQAITIALVVAAGVASLISSLTVYDTLSLTRDRYYRSSRFGTVFAEVKRAPRSVESRFAEIPGVAEWEARILFDVLLDMPGLNEPATGRFVSIPDFRDPRVNRLYLRSGRQPDPARSDEALVSEGFAKVHRLKAGSRVSAVLNGRYQRLTIVGTALSPEFLYAMAGQIPWPDDKRFGVFWLRQHALEAATDMDGAFNSVALILAPGASTPRALRQLDQLLAPYGSLGAYDRSEQTSARMLKGEIDQNRQMAFILPPIFLSVAVFLIFIVTNRLVRVQREQIAALKALGYSDRAISLHYLSLITAIVAAGTVLGILLGGWAGDATTGLYTEFFRFPVLPYQLNPLYPLIGGGMSWLAAAGGALNAVRWVTRLAPAEAMRPPSPPVYRRTWVEGLALVRLLSPEARITLRHILRSPVQSILTAVGISMSVAIMIAGLFWIDAIEYVMEVQFSQAQRDDAFVSFYTPLNTRALTELAHMPGVMAVEGLRSVPVRLRNGSRSYLTALEGLPEHSRFRRPLDQDLRPLAMPLEGVLLSQSLSRVLRVAPGDVLVVDVLEGRRPTRVLRVAALANDFIGVSAYMDKAALNAWMQEGPLSSGAALAVDPYRAADLYAELKGLPRVAGVGARRTIIELFRELTGRNIVVTSLILAVFASTIAVGVVYNSARIALSERAWELASLRVLGFTRGEVSRILLGKLAIELLAALPIGFLLGYGLCFWMLEAFVYTETLTLPLYITPRVYGLSAVVALVAGLFSAFLVYRRIQHLDLVGVLKSRD